MKLNLKFTLLTLAICYFNLPGFCQLRDSISLNSLINKTESFASNYPQEKVHIQFDKPYYAVNDTVWFKVYVTNGLNFLSNLSKVVYLDIFNKDEIIQTIKLPLSNGLAWGNTTLNSKQYKQGNYQVRAYTRWMMNFDADYFYHQTLSVGNSENQISTHISFTKNGEISTATILYTDAANLPISNKKVSWKIGELAKGKGITNQLGSISIPITSAQNVAVGKQDLTTDLEVNNKTLTYSFPIQPANTIDVQFFPESGDLINGVPTRIAFKALKANGLGVEVKGVVTDDAGKTITEFASQHLGMGSFILNPETGKNYKAEITSPAIYKGVYNLPKATANGITLMAGRNTLNDNVTIRFMCTDEYLSANKNKTYYLVAKSGETICYAAQTVLQRQLYTASLAKEKLPAGVLQITLFETSGKALNERLLFVRQKDNLNLNLKSDKTAYARKQKVWLTITAKNGLVPSEANLSLSVIDETKVPFNENNETTILSNLLLTSQLKGYIEKPNYYFNNPTAKTDADLDVLMLTQGYRRFLYENILADKKPSIYFLPEQGINLSGVLRTSNGMPIFKGNVKLRIPEKNYSAYTTTDGAGLFNFKNVVVPDSTEVIISSSDYRYKNPMLTIDPMVFQPDLKSSTWTGEQINIDSALNQYIVNAKRIAKNSRVLKEVVINAKAPSKGATHSDYPSLSGLSAWPDHLINKEQLTGCASFINCVKSMAMGVMFENENFYISRDFNAGKKIPMAVYFNGMPVDASYLNSINSLDIESVEIFLKDELGLVNRNTNTNGVLVINSKKLAKSKMSIDEIRNLLPKSGEVKIMPPGYAAVREFYSPKYLTSQSLVQTSDLRTTIYWNPKIKTDKTSGTTYVEFYNADGRGTYKATLEGIDSDGHPGRAVYRYKVE